MSSEIWKAIHEEAFDAVANVGGDFDDFVNWNYILYMYGLAPMPNTHIRENSEISDEYSSKVI